MDESEALGKLLKYTMYNIYVVINGVKFNRVLYVLHYVSTYVVTRYISMFYVIYFL